MRKDRKETIPWSQFYGTGLWDGIGQAEQVPEKENKRETILWSIKKQKWINGPDLPESIANMFDFKCAISVNSTTAFIFDILSTFVNSSTYSFNFEKKMWYEHQSPPDSIRIQIQIDSCVLNWSKKYQR